MKVNGTMINYYFHCKRQCWLFANRINLENNSEDVHIGRVLHELKYNGNENAEVSIENIKVDKITNDYLVEIKKSDADVEAAKWQTLLYLKILKEKGINRKGKIEFIEKNKQNKKIITLELTEEEKNKLNELENEIIEFVSSDKLPDPIYKPKCKKCAFYEYCFI